MQVELLVVAGCANEGTARERLRTALDRSGHAGTPVVLRTVTEQTLGSFAAFAGSPTILVDGVDPFAAQAAPGVGLSCRMYRSDAGLSGAPSVEALLRALGTVGPVEGEPTT